MKIPNISKDLRVQKTLAAIYQAFEELICEQDYEKITVAELARRAMINKKTFYRHYPTLDDLLAEVQEGYSEAYVDLIRGLEMPKDLPEMQRIFFEFSAKQGPAYDKITINQTSYTDIRQDMIDMVMVSTWGKSPAVQELSDFKKIALLNFVQQTGLSLYRQWVEEGRQTELEEVIKTAQLLTQSGVEALLSKD